MTKLAKSGKTAWHGFPNVSSRIAQCQQFPEDAKDASVSECTWTLSALEALRNALYKFKTYLLTYLPLALFGIKISSFILKTLCSKFGNGRMNARLDVCTNRWISEQVENIIWPPPASLPWRRDNNPQLGPLWNNMMIYALGCALIAILNVRTHWSGASVPSSLSLLYGTNVRSN